MKLADEIRAKYSKPHYTFEDVVNEIRRYVIASYEEVAKYKFSSWPGFGVMISNDVPKMEWTYGLEVSRTDYLKIPEGTTDFDLKKINQWFEEQGFVKTKNEYGRCEGWRIKF